MGRLRRYLRRCLPMALGLLAGWPAPACAAGSEARLAVAANFAAPARALVERFEATSSQRLTLSIASTGQLYAQIHNGAPFDLLLAADRQRPAQLIADGLAVPGTAFTYALGRLTLWSPRPDGVALDGAATLRTADFRHLAIANPALAPYGVAARQTLRALGLLDRLGERLVLGENVGQAHAMVASGGAELGLLALSQVLTLDAERAGSRWDVPDGLHEPIRQDMVLLTRAEDNSVARRFLVYLRSAEARALIARYGYHLPEL